MSTSLPQFTPSLLSGWTPSWAIELFCKSGSSDKVYILAGFPSRQIPTTANGVVTLAPVVAFWGRRELYQRRGVLCLSNHTKSAGGGQFQKLRRDDSLFHLVSEKLGKGYLYSLGGNPRADQRLEEFQKHGVVADEWWQTQREKYQAGSSRLGSFRSDGAEHRLRPLTPEDITSAVEEAKARSKPADVKPVKKAVRVSFDI
jgi:hypothetical protein